MEFQRFLSGYYKPCDKTEYSEDSPGGNFDFLSELAANWENASKLDTPDCQNVRRVVIRSGMNTYIILYDRSFFITMNLLSRQLSKTH